MPHTAELAHHRQAPATRNAIVALLVKVLRPLVTLMLKQGLTAYEFSEISRWVFAQVAMDRDQFAVRDRNVWSMTKSRAAVLTGLTRREVDRLLLMRAPAVDEARAAFHRSYRVLSGWMHDAGYQDPAGRPRDLPIKGPRGSLEWLVRSYCRDTPVRAMLDELVDRGCVIRMNDANVRFAHAELRGQELSAETVERLGRQAGHFMALLESALAEDSTAPHFVEVAAGPIAVEHRDALRRRITETVAAFAAQAGRDLSAHPKSLVNESNNQVVIGLYNGFV